MEARRRSDRPEVPPLVSGLASARGREHLRAGNSATERTFRKLTRRQLRPGASALDGPEKWPQVEKVDSHPPDRY